MSLLPQAEIEVLHEALDDEYRAWATYGQVLADFGAVRPFSNILDAEARHVQALKGLFVRHGLPIPANTWPGRVARHASLKQACEAAAATTPLRMLVSYPLVSAIDPPMLGALLSLSAGALVYVGTTHLLPKAEQERGRYSLVALAGGVAVAIVASKA